MKTESVKRLARKLESNLKSLGYVIPHSVILHGLARCAGDRDWHVLSANEKKDRSGLTHTDLSYLTDLVGREIGAEPEDRYLGHREVPKNLFKRLEKLEENGREVRTASNELLEFTRKFRQWHANHFDDFDSHVNAELLCLANDAQAAITEAEMGTGRNGCLTSTDLAYIHELVAAEDAMDGESKHLKEQTPEGILMRLAGVLPATLPQKRLPLSTDQTRRMGELREMDAGIHGELPLSNEEAAELHDLEVRDAARRTEADEEEHRFRLFYRHTDCPVTPGVEWDTTWSCACNDRCPECNREIEPFKVEDLLDGSIEYDEDQVPLASAAGSKRVYEVILPGFDGGTDATDDRIVWVAAVSKDMVTSHYPDAKVSLLSHVSVKDPAVDRTL